VSPVRLLEAIHAGTAPTILDVRSRWEFTRGHLPGAIHVPFWLMPARIPDVPIAKNSPVVVYCGHGPRAWLARVILESNGFSDVALLEGHMSAWKRMELPEER
jgi:rhodanese-related sulfurtransferase